MAGHSKWANIKHRKGAQDKKRGALFTKLIKEITVAARTGGDDLSSNSRLRTAVSKARENNMPADNIDRAIKKATGQLDGIIYEEVRYEGYGPGGIALLVDAITDNKNRTLPEVRTAFGKNGGNLGEAGCVAYMFDQKGVLIIDAGQTTEDDLMEILIDFDVEDIKADDDGSITVTTSPEAFNDVNDAIKEKGFSSNYGEITFVPQNTVDLDEEKAGKALRLVEILEDLDDVQNVYSNFDVSDEIMEKLGNQ